MLILMLVVGSCDFGCGTRIFSALVFLLFALSFWFPVIDSICSRVPSTCVPFLRAVRNVDEYCLGTLRSNVALYKVVLPLVVAGFLAW